MTAAEQLMQDSVDDEQMCKLMGIALQTLLNRISECRDHPPYYGKGKSRRFPLDEYRKWTKARLVHQKNR